MQGNWQVGSEDKNMKRFRKKSSKSKPIERAKRSDTSRKFREGGTLKAKKIFKFYTMSLKCGESQNLKKSKTTKI